MIYPILAATIVVIAVASALATFRLPRFGARMTASGIAAVVLIVLTAIFDNVMIGLGLFHYPPEHLSGLRIGLAPIEDFSYSVVAAFLVPSAWTLAGAWSTRRTRTGGRP